MSNSGFLTSNTCRLTPSNSNLGKVEATASKLLFTMRPLQLWGRSFEERMLVVFWEDLSWAFVTDSLIGYEIGKQPIRNTVSYGIYTAEGRLLRGQVPVLSSIIAKQITTTALVAEVAYLGLAAYSLRLKMTAWRRPRNIIKWQKKSQKLKFISLISWNRQRIWEFWQQIL